MVSERNDRYMKAVIIHQHGGPEVLKYEDAPEPQIKANEVLIRVRACSLNHLDLFIRAGIPGLKFAFPHVLGSDIAGEVVRTGELCDRVKPGMRVLLMSGYNEQDVSNLFAGKGLAGFLQKPFAATSLADVIGTALSPGDNWRPSISEV